MTLTTPSAILFDLDGTLADTAPDLAGALNKLRENRGLAATPYELLRPWASAGARGLIGAGFGMTPQDDGYEALRIEFLDIYEANMAMESRLFEGVTYLLEFLTSKNIAWGIVTNKAERFTNPLVPLLGLSASGCIISGDTTPHSKPHPAPLLEAAKRLELDPSTCWYVGDDKRDIDAGRAAGMPTIAAGWGYCGAAEPISWNADAIASSTAELLAMIDKVC